MKKSETKHLLLRLRVTPIEKKTIEASAKSQNLSTAAYILKMVNIKNS